MKQFKIRTSLPMKGAILLIALISFSYMDIVAAKEYGDLEIFLPGNRKLSKSKSTKYDGKGTKSKTSKSLKSALLTTIDGEDVVPVVQEANDSLTKKSKSVKSSKSQKVKGAVESLSSEAFSYKHKSKSPKVSQIKAKSASKSYKSQKTSKRPKDIYVSSGDEPYMESTKSSTTSKAPKHSKSQKSPKSLTTSKAPKHPKSQKSPKSLTTSKAPKHPKSQKSPTSPTTSKAPKHTKSQKSPKSTTTSKASKHPKSQKSPTPPTISKAPKHPKSQKSPTLPKLSKAPKYPKSQKSQKVSKQPVGSWSYKSPKSPKIRPSEGPSSFDTMFPSSDANVPDPSPNPTSISKTNDGPSSSPSTSGESKTSFNLNNEIVIPFNYTIEVDTEAIDNDGDVTQIVDSLENAVLEHFCLSSGCTSNSNRNLRKNFGRHLATMSMEMSDSRTITENTCTSNLSDASCNVAVSNSVTVGTDSGRVDVCRTIDSMEAFFNGIKPGDVAGVERATFEAPGTDCSAITSVEKGDEQTHVIEGSPFIVWYCVFILVSILSVICATNTCRSRKQALEEQKQKQAKALMNDENEDHDDDDDYVTDSEASSNLEQALTRNDHYFCRLDVRKCVSNTCASCNVESPVSSIEWVKIPM